MRCPALWAAFFRPPFLSEKRTPISKTLFRRNYLHFAAAGNFCCTSPDPRGGAFLRAPGSGGDLCTRECRELLVKGVPGTNCITPTPSMSHDRKRLQQTVPADPCLPLPTSLSTPPRSSALNWKSTIQILSYWKPCKSTDVRSLVLFFCLFFGGFGGAAPCGLWNIASLTRDQTCIPRSESTES